jgi:hypothetical protein
MNRAHDRVLIPPPARPVLAALALDGQPFGFSRNDVAAIRRAADRAADPAQLQAIRDLPARRAAMLPPEAAGD